MAFSGSGPVANHYSKSHLAKKIQKDAETSPLQQISVPVIEKLFRVGGVIYRPNFTIARNSLSLRLSRQILVRHNPPAIIQTA